MLKIDHLVAGYGLLEALHGISISLSAGQSIAVLGANGAGKTTLCRVLSGLIPAWSGTLLLDGNNLTGTTSVERVKNGIVLVPEGRQIFPQMSIDENLRLGAYIHGKPMLSELERAYSLFPILKVRLQQQAGLLSGGEQQMLALARALMSRPKYLLLDEPSQGLGPKIIEEMGEAISQISSQGVAILLVEQNLFLAELVCEKAFVLESGSVVASGPLKEILSTNLIKESYLGG